MSEQPTVQREVIIVAYGFEYLVMAINNARSIRRTNPGLQVVLVTNQPRGLTVLEQEFDRVVFDEQPTDQNRLAKIRCHTVAQADHVFYLDADSEVLGDLSPAFDLLHHYDVLLRPFELPSKFSFELLPGLDARHFTLFMGCTIFFRRSAAAVALFERWEDRFVHSGLKRDQPSLARAVLDTTETRILPLNAMWGSLGHHGCGPPAWPGRLPAVVYHYADVVNDADVLRRCTSVLEDVLRVSPPELHLASDVVATVQRFRRLNSRWYRNPVTTRVVQRWWRAQDARAASGHAETRKKASAAAGRVLGRENPRLWED